MAGSMELGLGSMTDDYGHQIHIPIEVSKLLAFVNTLNFYLQVRVNFNAEVECVLR